MIIGSLEAAERREWRGFRWRGREVSRIEALSDAVFGFAITLLVVSLEVPRTAAELLHAMRGMVAFAACFAMLFLVWHHQYRFFRRYGLEDTVTMLLNGVLLFVVLFFVYPLKFLWGHMIGRLMGDPAWVPGPGGTRLPVIAPAEAGTLMVVFGLGYVAVFGIFALLHLHALRMREALELDALEEFDTRDNIRETLLNVAIGMLSILLVAVGGAGNAGFAGITYWLVGPALGIHGWLSGRARGRLAARLAGRAAAPGSMLAG
jgi:uncharacterized membrane protein